MTTATDLAPAETATKPVKVFRVRGLSASVFYNRATVRDREMIFPKVHLQRTYKFGDAFKTTTSLGRDDLPVAQLLLHQAWEWILNEEAARRKKAE